jgi:hypothetical protein
MNDIEYEKQKSRWIKEFVYDQWRKILTIFVIGDDVSRNEFKPKDVTSEQIRTVFNNGYKLAMLQTKKSLVNEILSERDNEKNIKILEKLLSQVEDRLETQKCYVLYKGWFDKTLLEEAIKREEEFKPNLNTDMTKWGDRSM